MRTLVILVLPIEAVLYTPILWMSIWVKQFFWICGQCRRHRWWCSKLLCNLSCQILEVFGRSILCPQRWVCRLLFFKVYVLWISTFAPSSFKWPVSLIRKTMNDFWSIYLMCRGSPNTINSRTYTRMMTVKTMWMYTFPSDSSRLNPNFSKLIR